MTKINAWLVLSTDWNKKNTGLAEHFRSICYPRERVLFEQPPLRVGLDFILFAGLEAATEVPDHLKARISRWSSLSTIQESMCAS